MIGFLPTPYPDELLYSICARFYDRVRYENYQDVLLELFGTDEEIKFISPTAHLNHLIEALPAGHHFTVQRLIDQHTFIPFYRPFVPLQQINSLYQKPKNLIRGPKRRANLCQIRESIHSVAPSRFQYCPICIEEDKKQFGESYWHRVHQITGVSVCPIHAVYLEISDVSRQNFEQEKLNEHGKYKPYGLTSLEEVITVKDARFLNLKDRSDKTLLTLSQDALWLLNQSNLFLNLQLLKKRYYELLNDFGFICFTDDISEIKVYKREFLMLFLRYCSSDLFPHLLTQLGLVSSPSIWVVELLEFEKAEYHPNQHLLLINFLMRTAETFFDFPSKN